MYVLESARALRGGERRGSVTPVYIYTYIYSTCVSHFAWAIICKVTGTLFDTHESEKFSSVSFHIHRKSNEN